MRWLAFATTLGVLLPTAAIASAQAIEVMTPAEPPEATTASTVADDPARPSDEWTDPELEVSYPRRAHLAVVASAGGGVRSLHGSAIGGGELEVALLSEGRAGGYGGGFHFFAGRTESGLTMRQLTLGPVLEWPIGIVRLGIEPRVGFTWINRVTTDSLFDSLTLGASARASVDVFSSRGYVLALGVEPVAEALLPFLDIFQDQSGEAALLGANAFLQFRFRERRKPRLTPDVASATSSPP